MTSKYEQQKLAQGYNCVIGCDEVGRGCLAGPVVAAAVVLKNINQDEWFKSIKDSKLLSPALREQLVPVIKENAVAWAVGQVEHKVIDEINIHNASLLAMRRAVESLLADKSRILNPLSLTNTKGSLDPLSDASGPVRDDKQNVIICLDGKFVIPEFNMKQEAIIGGDAKILSIAAASIIAKVYRDNLMKKFDEAYPSYNFAQHKGYATLRHRKSIKKFGLTPIHRISFCGNYSR